MRALSRRIAGFRYAGRTLALVWQLERRLTLVLLSLTALAGLIPVAIAWVGRGVVDTVVTLAAAGPQAPLRALLVWVSIEAALVLSLAAAARGAAVAHGILRVKLGHRVERRLLDKARRLPLPAFEDSGFYDRLVRAQREVDTRPLSMVTRVGTLTRNLLTLASAAVLLAALGPWVVLALVAAAVPAVVVEARFSGQAFRLANRHAPETRERAYLASLLTRDDHAKEVRSFDLGAALLDRYDRVFARVFAKDRALALRRGAWGYAMSILGTLVFFGLYAWIALEAARARITLGEMTMYLALVRQGQTAVTALLTTVGGAYEDNLYLSNLFAFLDHPLPNQPESIPVAPRPGDGLRLEGVTFRYPGAERDALCDVDLHLPPGRTVALVGGNGSGKSTLVKLLTGLYRPTSGRVLLDGLELHRWDEGVLRSRMSLVYQDFLRYQMTARDNVALGDIARIDDELGAQRAARQGLAHPFVEELPRGYSTQLGRWFDEGIELSGGQWQKLALSRAFMRGGAEVLILDEPTSAMDPQAEHEVFCHVRAQAGDRTVILVSHRFSTVRAADEIVVLEAGGVVERGDHEGLLARRGRYARLFTLQAAGYR